MSTVVRIRPGGRVTAIHDDDFPFSRALGAEFTRSRRRASLIDTVRTGPHAGSFFADMTHLADLTGDDRHRVCLWPPTTSEAACKQLEFNYVRDHFVLA